MDKDNLIRERAYMLWEQAGRPDGNGEQFWFAAIASIGAELPEAAAATTSGRPAAEASQTQKQPTKTAVRRQAGAVVSSRTAAKPNGKGVAKTLTSIRPAGATSAMLPS